MLILANGCYGNEQNKSLNIKICEYVGIFPQKCINYLFFCYANYLETIKRYIKNSLCLQDDMDDAILIWNSFPEWKSKWLIKEIVFLSCSNMYIFKIKDQNVIGIIYSYLANKMLYLYSSVIKIRRCFMLFLLYLQRSVRLLFFCGN